MQKVSHSSHKLFSGINYLFDPFYSYAKFSEKNLYIIITIYIIILWI